MIVSEMERKAAWLRRLVLECAVRSKSGHVTTAFSQMDMLVALYYGGILKYDPGDRKWAGRDRLILSKGQGGLGLYPILADLGFFPMRHMENFAARDSILGVHAEWNIPGVEVITGSLGHGLPIATGMAVAARDAGLGHLVVCLTGDAELNEGSNWEALLFAAGARLGNLIVVVDRNGLGTLGRTDDGIETKMDGPSLDPLGAKIKAFGLEVRHCDGHDYDDIFRAFEGVRQRDAHSYPLCVISESIKGKGTRVFEGKRGWHYRFPSGGDLERARLDLPWPEGLEVPEAFRDVGVGVAAPGGY